MKFFYLASLLVPAATASDCLPVVDLGYERHQAIAYNETSALYNFTNIRYAQPPVGDLRFAAPKAPEGRDPDIQDGSGWRQCPQAYPFWSLIAGLYGGAFVAGTADSFDYPAAVAQVEAFIKQQGIPAVYAQPNPAITEDCLFLDVVVPKAVYESQTAKAPVVVWLHGGAFSAGQKNYHNSGNPSGLIKVSQEDGSDGIVYVTLNYRLGTLGFLSGSTFQSQGGVSNGGLLDQHLALQWVQDHIHRFGGDPDQVTVIGASAGGASIMHALTAYGGTNTPRFQRAISLSAGYQIYTSDMQLENATETFYSLLGVTSLDEARAASTEDVILANARIIGRAPYTSFPFGPSLDGSLVAQHSSIEFLQGNYNRDVQVMTGHTLNEGITFAPPYVKTDEELHSFLRGLFPTVTDKALQHITGVLYPEEGVDRTMTMISDLGMKCHTDYLRRAYDHQTYGYEFLIPPAFHGGDFGFYMYSGAEPEDLEGDAASTAQRARTLQRYMANFVKKGDPNGPGLDTFPVAGESSLRLAITSDRLEIGPDATNSERCRWLQQVLYG